MQKCAFDSLSSNLRCITSLFPVLCNIAKINFSLSILKKSVCQRDFFSFLLYTTPLVFKKSSLRRAVWSFPSGSTLGVIKKKSCQGLKLLIFTKFSTPSATACSVNRCITVIELMPVFLPYWTWKEAHVMGWQWCGITVTIFLWVMEQSMYCSKIENINFYELKSEFSISVPVDLDFVLLLT